MTAQRPLTDVLSRRMSGAVWVGTTVSLIHANTLTGLTPTRLVENCCVAAEEIEFQLNSSWSMSKDETGCKRRVKLSLWFDVPLVMFTSQEV